MYLLIIDNSDSDTRKEFIVRKLSRPYIKSIKDLLKDNEIASMIIDTLIRDYDDDPEGYYFDEKNSLPNIEKFKKSLEITDFYETVKARLDYIIDTRANFVEIGTIETIP